MADNVIQHSFSSGELSPSLLARTDIPKYKSGAATMRNFLVDFRSGASTRSGLAFCNQTKFNTQTRLIDFQFSAEVGYIIEFGQGYCRFFVNGGAVLNAPFAVTGITNANPAVATVTGNNFAVGQWIFITGVVGMPQINNRYFNVSVVAGANVTLQTTQGVNVDATGYGTYTSGGTAASVYEIASPYAAADLPLLKFAQLANTMVLVHQNYVPYLLTAFAATNWTLNAMIFGPSINPPTITSGTPTASGTANYSYIVTAVDVNGQESGPSTAFAVNSAVNIGTTAGSINLVWSSAVGAVSYNVYKAEVGVGNVVPTGSAYGFISNVTGLSLVDSNFVPDFAISPPIPSFFTTGLGVTSYIVTASGTYTSVPTVSVAAPPGGQTATAVASLGITVATIASHDSGGDVLVLRSAGASPVGSNLTLPNGVVLHIVAAHQITGTFTTASWSIDTVSILSPGTISTGSTPGNPVHPTGCSVAGFQGIGGNFAFNLTWGVTQVTVGSTTGFGYVMGSPPAVTFSAGAAAATAVLGAPVATNNPLSNGDPGCTTFFQQRLYFAGSIQSPTTFWASQPGLYTNFDISNPVIDSDAIVGTLVSAQFNTIKSMLTMPGGLLFLTASGAWQLSSGAGGLASTSAVTPTNATATPQAYNGASDIPPIIINYDILYVQSKGSIVRDLSYNIYANIYTGSDISVLSNHLFFGHLAKEWTWTEEPFRIVWLVRDDGILLSLTYVKDQEMLGWARHDTNGQFKSTASIREGINDTAYFIVSRDINGTIVQSVERLVPRLLTYGAEDGFSVDCGFTSAVYLPTPAANLLASSFTGAVTFTADATISPTPVVGQILRMNGGIAVIGAVVSGTSFSGTWIQPIPNPIPSTVQVAALGAWTLATPATTFYGLDYLNGMTVSILADGQVAPQQVITGGSITLPFAATKVTVGLPFQAQLQTMYLDVGEPTIQGKRKIIPRVTVRAREARGIKMGRTFPTILPIKQFNPVATGTPITTTPAPSLVSTDVYYVMDPLWETAGQLCIQIDDPVPASVLGVVPEVVLGDTNGGRGK